MYRRDTLVVRTPNANVMFVMKLHRADPQDRQAMINLRPMCNFVTPEEAARACGAGYPHAPKDDHLVDYINDVARDAGRG